MPDIYPSPAKPFIWQRPPRQPNPFKNDPCAVVLIKAVVLAVVLLRFTWHERGGAG